MEVVVHGQGATMFSDEELEGIVNIERGLNHFEVECLLKSTRLGEPSGKLKIFPHGKLEIKCECSCREDKFSPRSFLKHYEKNDQLGDWKNQIYVNTKEDKRIPLRKTHLLKYYYRERPEEVKGTLRPRQAVHRDEFIRCSQCGKERRFRLRTADDCRAFHDAFAKENWTCSDAPYERITCGDPEERQSRKVRRGCPQSDRCSGCMSCVCVGCGICRFKGCPCLTCADYIDNIGQ